MRENGDFKALTDVMGDDNAAVERRLSHAGARIKAQLGLRQSAIELNADGIRARGFAGALRLGNLDLEVRPKCLVNSDSDAWRPALIEMMRVAGRWKGQLREPTSITGGATWFPDVAALSFAHALERGLAFGPLTDYVRLEDEGPYLRGRLRVREQVDLLWTRPWLVAFDADELTKENVFNHLLAVAGARLFRSVRAPFIRQRLDGALQRLGVSGVGTPGPEALTRPLPPQHSAYVEAVDMARLLLSRKSPGEGPLLFGTPGLILNTEVLFQEYVSGLLRRIAPKLAASFKTSRQQQTFMETPATGESLYVIPDDRFIDDSGKTCLIVDAKYRLVTDRSPRPKPAEWHQVLTGMIAENASSGLLIYPASLSERHGEYGEWRVDLDGRSVRLATTCVDVSSCANPGSLESSISHLRTVVQSLV